MTRLAIACESVDQKGCHTMPIVETPYAQSGWIAMTDIVQKYTFRVLWDAGYRVVGSGGVPKDAIDVQYGPTGASRPVDRGRCGQAWIGRWYTTETLQREVK